MTTTIFPVKRALVTEGGAFYGFEEERLTESATAADADDAAQRLSQQEPGALFASFEPHGLSFGTRAWFRDGAELGTDDDERGGCACHSEPCECAEYAESDHCLNWDDEPVRSRDEGREDFHSDG